MLPGSELLKESLFLSTDVTLRLRSFCVEFSDCCFGHLISVRRTSEQYTDYVEGMAFYEPPVILDRVWNLIKQHT